MSELTIEITDYCPHRCKFCSSYATEDYLRAKWMKPWVVQHALSGKRYGIINISGGEPLASPHFWEILQECKRHASVVRVYTNALTNIVYNAHVIDGIYLQANVTVTPETDSVHILRRVKQGREAGRPDVHLSCNHAKECEGTCDHHVIRPDGSTSKTPCAKWEE